MRLSATVLALAFAGIASTAIPGAACPYDRQAVSTHSRVVRLFRGCSEARAKGESCNEALRDATLQGLLATGAAALLGKCGDVVSGLGFSSEADLVGQLVGNAAGEARHLVDLAYGREAVPLAAEERKCAKTLVSKGAVALKKMVKKRIRCAPNCNVALDPYIDGLFVDATDKMAKACSPAAIASLVGGDLTAFVDEVRASGERLSNSRTAKPKPSVHVIAPILNTSFEPSSLPATIAVAAELSKVGSQAYVTSLEVNGFEATYNPATERFEHDLQVTNFQNPDFPIFFKMRTTRGTLVGTSNLKISLAGLTSDVIIATPQSGIITSGSSVNVSGFVLNVANAGPLYVGGLPTTYATGGLFPGFFSKTVPLGTDPVQIIEAEIHSAGLGETRTDSVVVLRGTPLDVDFLVPNAVSIRVNDAGFAAANSKILAQVEPILEPENLIGFEVSGQEVCDFDHGPIETALESFGPGTMRLEVAIDDFELDICFSYLAANCVAHYVAGAVEVTTEFDFVSDGGTLGVDVASTTTQFVNDGFSAIDGPPECVNGIVLGGAHTAIEAAIAGVASDEVPPAIEAAVQDIDLGTPLSQGLGMELVGLHLEPLEDTHGVTFRMDANATELVPVTGGLPLPEFSLVPLGGGTPILNATIPGTSTGYGLGLWVSDAFLNRYVTALLRAGELHLNVSEIPLPVAADPDCVDPEDPDCSKLPLDSGILGAIFLDPAYQAACVASCPSCTSCPAYLALQPTAGAVVRPVTGAEQGDFVLVIPNYRADAVSFLGFGEVLHYLTVLATFEIPITLDVSADAITPTAGALKVTNVRVQQNPIGADETAVPPVVEDLFPLAAGAIAGSFSGLPLPGFEGLQLVGVGSGYNVSGTALYMSLTPP